MKALIPDRFRGGTVAVPGSKSYTHRALIAAGLGCGTCRVVRPLESEDIRVTRRNLERLGVAIRAEGGDLVVTGCAGRPAACAEPLEMGHSGTSMRLLAGVAALGQGDYLLTGSPRMQQRPMGDLLAGLRSAGVLARDLRGNGCPPIALQGGGLRGGAVSLDAGRSSQFLSALLLAAPLATRGMEIRVTAGPVSRPYIDLTVAVMEAFGIRLAREGYTRFSVPGGQTYAASRYTVEPDCSQAGYFWAAAALTATTVAVTGIGPDSRQGDLRLVEVLEAMGCRIDRMPGALAVTGGGLRAVEVSMGDVPDVVPTLAVVAAFARGRTVMHDVAHLRLKESDRLAAVVEGLRRMGIAARATCDSLVVEGGRPHGARIDPCDDHRMAMSFALAGLRIRGMQIAQPECVAKSFPGFWDTIESLMEGAGEAALQSGIGPSPPA
jgi:3-phosphoshikimate 1-carboxyvinyltransferase